MKTIQEFKREILQKLLEMGYSISVFPDSFENSRKFVNEAQLSEWEYFRIIACWIDAIDAGIRKKRDEKYLGDIISDYFKDEA